MVEITSELMDDNANTNAVTANMIHLIVGDDAAIPEPDAPRELEVSTLNQCFYAVLLRRKVRISFTSYKAMVQHDLQVEEIATMNESDVTILAKSLNYFMTQWPGWAHRLTFINGPTPITTWFEDYQAYLKDRVMYVVNNMEALWQEGIAEHVLEIELKKQANLANGEAPAAQDNAETPEIKTESNTLDCCVQTDQFEFAPYHLAFSGQPAVLNSLYFVKTKDGKLAGRFHEPLKLDSMSAKQLLNSPYVSVNVTLPEISFGRKMDHKYTRFITIRPLKKGAPNSEEKIHYIKRMDTSKYDTAVYTYNFLRKYFIQFFIVIKKHKLITEERIIEIETIASEFLKDIEDCNLYDYTMATNMSVTFNLGGHTYVRNKTWRQGKHGTISYVERIDPRSTFFLKSVTAEQDKTTIESTFTLLNKIDRALSNNDTDNQDVTLFQQQLRDTQNSISYSCTLCEKVFSYYQLLYKHYRFQHGGEQAVLCEVCGEKQNMLILTNKRWEHRCREVPKDEPIDNVVNTSASDPLALECNEASNDGSSRSGVGSFLSTLSILKEEGPKEEPKDEYISMEVVEVEVGDTVVNGCS